MSRGKGVKHTRGIFEFRRDYLWKVPELSGRNWNSVRSAGSLHAMSQKDTEEFRLSDLQLNYFLEPLFRGYNMPKGMER